jgi:hypothetical protein
MLPHAYVVHQAGERLRLRIPAHKGDAAFFARVERDLATCAGVAYAEANPLTASILLHFSGELASLAAFTTANRLFTLEPVQAPVGTALDVVADRVDQLERFVRHRSNGALDLDTLMVVGLVGASIVQIARGQVLGPASTLLANAAGILALHRARRAGR